MFSFDLFFFFFELFAQIKYGLQKIDFSTLKDLCFLLGGEEITTFKLMSGRCSSRKNLNIFSLHSMSFSINNCDLMTLGQ